MDVAAIRNRMFTGFKPKEQDIDTPYLEELDGELKLVGLTGKQRLDLEEQSTDAKGKLQWQKFIALALASCLRARSTGEKIFSVQDTLGPSGNGDGLAAELDSDAYVSLIRQVSAFIGKGKTAEEKKTNSLQTNENSHVTSQPQDSEEPSENS